MAERLFDLNIEARTVECGSVGVRGQGVLTRYLGQTSVAALDKARA